MTIERIRLGGYILGKTYDYDRFVHQSNAGDINTDIEVFNITGEGVVNIKMFCQNNAASLIKPKLKVDGEVNTSLDGVNTFNFLYHANDGTYSYIELTVPFTESLTIELNVTQTMINTIFNIQTYI